MAHLVHIEGPVPYSLGQAIQEQLLDLRIHNRISDTVLLLEHEPVITVGRAKNARADIQPQNPLPTVDVKRGGDVTLHAPGQYVAYPIVQLTGARRDLLDHMRRLESGIIELLAQFGLTGQRDDRNTGVWLPDVSGEPLKICSIGIACRKWVTWHGLALNWDIDLSLYQHLNPCGFSADVMTRAVDRLSDRPPSQTVRAQLGLCLGRVLELSPLQTHRVSVDQLSEIPEFLANCPTDE